MHFLAAVLAFIVFKVKKRTTKSSNSCSRIFSNKRNLKKDIREPLILNRNNLIPVDWVKIDIREMLLRRLYTTVIIVVQLERQSLSFSGILINVEKDYTELMKLEYIYGIPCRICRRFIVTIPINKIAAVCVPFI